MALCPNRCGSLLNVLFALAFLGFFAYSGNQIVHVISPPASASGSGTINPTWKVGSPVQVLAALSTQATNVSPERLHSAVVVLNASSSYDYARESQAAIDITLALPLHGKFQPSNLLPGDLPDPHIDSVAPPPGSRQAKEASRLQASLRSGHAVFLWVWLQQLGGTSHPRLTSVVPLMIRKPFMPPAHRSKLWEADPSAWLGFRLLASVPPPPAWWPAEGADTAQWLGAADIRVSVDTTRYPAGMAGMNPFQRSLLSQNLVHAEGYAPALSVNSIRPVAERRRWALAANSSAVALPLHITATFTSPQQANLLHIMDASLSQQQDQMGLADSDTDDVVRLLVDTPLWLLGLTFLISAVHLCLDVLAFANDVSFWSAVSTSTLSRLSLRALAADLLCQSIVGAYLWQNAASVLLLIPTALGIAVGAWKLSKTLASSQGASFTTPATPSQRYDAEAAQYMLWLLAPLLLGWAAFALIMNEHQGWGDYALSTAVAAVYASGFALACPQLLINYRLKSVAHMPWSVLFYRWCSVCIDDVFAFIIKMPTLHRLSVFRDDVVFLLYLAQRWYYPVDSGRTATVTGEGELPPPAEAGPACDDPKPRKGACSAREAYATLLTSDSFLPGVQALAFSLRRFDSTRPLLVLHTPSVKRHTRIMLSRLQGAQLVPVDDIPCPHAEQVHVDGWVNSGYTKLHIWSLTDWHRIVYLDADTLVMADISDLFTCPTPAAAPDVFPPDKFNAGVLAITPSTSEFERLRRAVPTAPSHDGGDTGFLNSMYPGWFSGAEGHRLPFGDNAQRILHWFTAEQAPGYWEAVQPLRVLHFSSSPKPWEGEGARRKGELEMLWWRTWMASKVPPGLGQLLAGGGDGSAPQTNSSK